MMSGTVVLVVVELVNIDRLTSIQDIGLSRMIPMIMIGFIISQQPVVICPSQLSSSDPNGTREPSEPRRARKNVVRTRA